MTSEELEALVEPVPYDDSQPQQAIDYETDYFKGVVREILEDDVYDLGGYAQPYQLLEVEIISGSDKGVRFRHEFQIANNNVEKQKLKKGDKVVVVKIIGQEIEYYVAEPYRTPAIFFLLLFFVILAVAFAGKRGFMSLVGLAFSLLVILKFIIPQIAAGRNPVIVALIGSLVILFFAIYLAHGFKRRTHVALVGTMISLVFAVIISMISVGAAKMFGLGSEEAISLLQGQFASINFQGLFLAGILIGALGVLDDITTAQSATVEEIHRANPKLSAKELYKRGSSVGKEHISSLVNTLALAYVGASMPLFLIFLKVDFPFWVNFNSEFLMEEVIRTVIGSIALILAVPITTYIAARVFEKEPVDHKDDQEIFHTHKH